MPVIVKLSDGSEAYVGGSETDFKLMLEAALLSRDKCIRISPTDGNAAMWVPPSNVAWFKAL